MTNNDPQLINPLFIAVVQRLLLFGLLWWLLNNGNNLSWIVGAPAVIIAVTISFKLTAKRHWRWRPLAVLSFVPFFVFESLRGGWDVSRRVLRPSLSINPGIIFHNTQLPPGVPRMLLLNVTSLLPGTLSADLRDICLTVHVLDRDTPIAAEIKRLETRIAGLFIFHRPGESL